MKNFKLGQKVIVNTGGNDTVAFIDNPIKNVHGFYWKDQNSYLCRFTDDPTKLLCNGAQTRDNYKGENVEIYVHENSQYIPAQYIREAN